jgi:hypothetical protein
VHDGTQQVLEWGGGGATNAKSGVTDASDKHLNGCD